MNVRECYSILGVPPGSDMAQVKAAFRKLAFQLHPDLNSSPDAGDRFRQVNEAYVLLSQALDEESGRAKNRAQPEQEQEQPKANPSAAAGAYERQKRQSAAGKASRWSRAGQQSGQTAADAGARTRFSAQRTVREEELLRDLLKDPFARKVFEDIYQQVKTKNPGARTPQRVRERRLDLTWGRKRLSMDLSRGVVGGAKHWLKKQFDEERVMHFPASTLFPGRTIRITVQPRFAKERMVVVTLPPDFSPGKPIRLKGLGKRLGPIRGDLILRLLPK